MSRRVRFVYLASMPYSGSTLFSFLANSHPQIATVGEMTGPTESVDPETYLCSCGQRIKHCAFWQEVAKGMASRGFDFDPGHFDTRIHVGDFRHLRRALTGSLGSSGLEDIRDRLLWLWPSQSERLRELLARNKALASVILAVTGKSIFFDASKDHMTIRRLSRDGEVDLRVVHLVRDVRGAGLSGKKNARVSWPRTVASWVRTNRNIERQLRRVPADRWIRIRYEDLCRDPQETLNRFFEFCGAGHHTLTSLFRSPEHHIVGNSMRLGYAGKIKLDESWRDVLTRDELECAERLAGSVHCRYGYAPMRAADLNSGALYKR